jgi:hypothetical protein
VANSGPFVKAAADRIFDGQLSLYLMRAKDVKKRYEGPYAKKCHIYQITQYGARSTYDRCIDFNIDEYPVQLIKRLDSKLKAMDRELGD